MTFEPHPREFFAPDQAPTRLTNLREKFELLAEFGVDRVQLVRFNFDFARITAEEFVTRILVRGLAVRWLLVGDDFRFGARRAGDYATLDAAGARAGFDVARMLSYEVHGQRVSSSAVRDALAGGDMARVAGLLGRPYAISGHVLPGRRLGRELGFRTLNLRFAHERPAAMGIFVVAVHGLGPEPLPAVASLGVRPTVESAGRVLLETHVLDWPANLHAEAGYGRVIRVELRHKLHDERKYASIDALRAAIADDTAQARAWWSAKPESMRR